MALTGDEYARYRERIQEHMDQELQNDQTYMNRLAKLYRRTQSDIQKEIDSSLQTFAVNNELSMAEAKRKIRTTDVQAYKDDRDSYMDDDQLSRQAKDRINAYNITTRTNRLQLLQARIHLLTVALASEEVAELQAHLAKEYLEEYEWQAGFMGVTVPSRKSLERQAKAVIRGSFHNAHFSDRIWQNQSELQGELERLISRTVIQGKHPLEGSKDLQKYVREEFKNKKHASDRLAITETARVQGDAAIQAVKDNGFSQFVWMAEHDNRTCRPCMDLDGEVFEVEDALIGKNVPPIHPFDRCAIAPYADREAWERSLEERGL